MKYWGVGSLIDKSWCNVIYYNLTVLLLYNLWCDFMNLLKEPHTEIYKFSTRQHGPHFTQIFLVQNPTICQLSIQVDNNSPLCCTFKFNKNNLFICCLKNLRSMHTGTISNKNIYRDLIACHTSYHPQVHQSFCDWHILWQCRPCKQCSDHANK
jgi:hypothetical protein